MVKPDRPAHEIVQVDSEELLKACYDVRIEGVSQHIAFSAKAEDRR